MSSSLSAPFRSSFTQTLSSTLNTIRGVVAVLDVVSMCSPSTVPTSPQDMVLTTVSVSFYTLFVLLKILMKINEFALRGHFLACIAIERQHWIDWLVPIPCSTN